MIETKICEYGKFKGYLCFDPSKKRRPGVLVGHAWMGQNDFARKRAHAIAELGYVGFAIDMYGSGKEVKTEEEALSLMRPLLEDRNELRARMNLALETLKNFDTVDPKNTAAIGHCFGGTCALELARTGTSFKGAVSFHGVLGNPHKIDMKPVQNSPKIIPSILLLHGYKDPFVTQEDLRAFEKEMSDSSADWEMIVYGQASHAFTNPAVHNPEKGLIYHELTEKRSWNHMKLFLEEIFR